MNKKTELTTVLQKIDELREMVIKHLDNPHNIPTIESALVKEKLQFAYDVYFKLSNLPIPKPENKLEENNQESKEEKEVEIIKPQLENNIDNLEETVYESVIPPPEEDTVILSVENKPDLFPDEKKEAEELKTVEAQGENDLASMEIPVENKPELFPDQQKENEIKIFPEENIDLFSTTFDSDAKTVAEEISENVNEESVADKFQKNKITDLKEAIGINEKFYFINELFDGVMKEYNEAIEAVNKYSSQEEAFDYLNQLKGEHDWKEESEAFGQLRDILERKFN